MSDTDKQKDLFGLKLADKERLREIDDSLKQPDKPKPLSKVARRAIETSIDIEMAPPELISYQHTVLCQTSLPYRNQGKEISMDFHYDN